MGRITTPTYRLEITEYAPIVGRQCHSQVWRGKATAQRLERYIYDYGKSLELGGVNEHISKRLGYVPYPNRAKIVHQKSNTVVAEWKAAMFQVW